MTLARINHLLIAAALAAAFSPIPSATRAPSGLEFGIGERLPHPSLIGASTTNGAPRALTVVSYRDAVARVFAGRAGAARPMLLDGVPGLVYAHDGRPVSLFRITSEDGRIVAIEMVADPATIAEVARAVRAAISRMLRQKRSAVSSSSRGSNRTGEGAVGKSALLER